MRKRSKNDWKIFADPALPKWGVREIVGEWGNVYHILVWGSGTLTFVEAEALTRKD